MLVRPRTADSSRKKNIVLKYLLHSSTTAMFFKIVARLI